jgi:16S rRNA (guanine1516-N2)-methyltransferase
MAELELDFIHDKKNYLKPIPKGLAELLPKAVGLKKGYLRIIDATAGLLQDAIVLARLGGQIFAIERHPGVAAALAEALQKGQLAKGEGGEMLAPWLMNINLVHGDSREILGKLPRSDWPDVVYLDPMFKHSKSKSLPRKEMQVFRELVGEDLDFLELLATARRCAKFRVVVKTAIQGDPRLPSGANQISGKTVQFHIFQPTHSIDFSPSV